MTNRATPLLGSTHRIRHPHTTPVGATLVVALNGTVAHLQRTAFAQSRRMQYIPWNHQGPNCTGESHSPIPIELPTFHCRGESRSPIPIEIHSRAYAIRPNQSPYTSMLSAIKNVSCLFCSRVTLSRVTLISNKFIHLLNNHFESVRPWS